MEIFSGFPVSSFLGKSFRTRIQTPEPIFLGGYYELEFSAALPQGAAVEGLPITTSILTGGEEINLISGTVLPLGSDGWGPAKGFGGAAQRFTVDLSSFRGQAIELKWVVGSGSDDHEAYLFSPRLRAKVRTRPPDVLMVCSDTHRFDHSLEDRGQTLMPALQRLVL